jgi:hypothetical protein
MDYFEQGGVYVAIYFLCLAASAAVVAVAWTRVSPGRAAGAIGGVLAGLAMRTAMVGAATIVCAAVILMFAFPKATPGILIHLLGNVLLALAVVGLAAAATHFVFSRVSTSRAIVLLTAATALFYVGVAIGMQRLNDSLLQRASRQREAKEAARADRARLDAATLETREEALRKKLPLVPYGEPYSSVYRCVTPLLAAREASYRAERRWPEDAAAVAAIALDPGCRASAASALPGGGLRVTTEDDTLPPWGRKVARKPEPFDPPLPLLQLYFLPATEGDGALRWLCTAPYQPKIASRFPGCGYWTPSAVEIAGSE